MSKYAWVTLSTNDSYSLGALVLGYSLRQSGTSHQLVVLITKGVTPSMRSILSSVFDVVEEVNILDSKDETNLKLLNRPELGITFTKLHCWRLVQFEKCVFLDADTMVLENVDELFERNELSAAPDVGWPDCFNSGVFVFTPSNQTYKNLVNFALEKGSFDGGDQGLLNLYFSDWAHKDISKHLPFIYNMCTTACYSYLPAFKQFGGNVKIVHFIGNTKPWLQFFDPETKQVKPSHDLQHLTSLLQHWWNIFCSAIHPQLSSDMARSEWHTTLNYNLNILNLSDYYFHNFTNLPFCEQSEFQVVWDPWEENISNRIININIETEDLVSDTVKWNLIQENVDSIKSKIDNKEENLYSENIHQSKNSNATVYRESKYSNVIENACDFFLDVEPKSHNFTDKSGVIKKQINADDCSSIDEKKCDVENFNNNYPLIQYIPIKPIHSKSECEVCEPARPITIKTSLQPSGTDNTNKTAGFAGAFANLTLGKPRSFEQNVIEDQLRRQNWEIGNADYMHLDSFGNIWSKICETLETSDSANKVKEGGTGTITHENNN